MTFYAAAALRYLTKNDPELDRAVAALEKMVLIAQAAAAGIQVDPDAG